MTLGDLRQRRDCSCQSGGASDEFRLHDVVAGDAVLQVRGRVQRDEFAVVHDGDAVAQLVGFVHVVRGEQDGEADCSLAAFRIISHTLVRETGSRPVVGSSRNRMLRRMHQAARDFQAPAHAAGKRAHQRFAEARQVHGFQQFARSASGAPFAGTP